MNGAYYDSSSNKYLSPLVLDWLGFAFWLKQVLAVWF